MDGGYPLCALLRSQETFEGINASLQNLIEFQLAFVVDFVHSEGVPAHGADIHFLFSNETVKEEEVLAVFRFVETHQFVVEFHHEREYFDFVDVCE